MDLACLWLAEWALGALERQKDLVQVLQGHETKMMSSHFLHPYSQDMESTRNRSLDLYKPVRPRGIRTLEHHTKLAHHLQLPQKARSCQKSKSLEHCSR